MTDPVETAPGRTIDIETRIEAPAEAVWRALTEAEHIKNWFPPDARVEPGEGGSIWMSWGEGVEGTAHIEIWEPNARLRLTEQWAGARTVIDYFITAESSEVTVLRLVHSGFGEEESWDDFYQGTLTGWSYFMRHLKLYLERFRGMVRTMVKDRRPMAVTREVVWRRVLTRTGAAALAVVSPGDVLDFTLGGETQPAVVELAKAPGAMALRLPELGDALLFIELEPGGETWHCGVWLSTYGLPAERQAALRAAVGALADDLSAP